MSVQRRLALALICGLTLLLMAGQFVYAHTVGNQGYRGYIEGRPELDGTEVVLSLMQVSAIQDANHYQLMEGGVVLNVEGPTQDLVVGHDVTVGGRYDASTRTTHAEWVEQRGAGRVAKMWLGILGVFLSLVLVAMSVRPAPGGLVIRG